MNRFIVRREPRPFANLQGVPGFGLRRDWPPAASPHAEASTDAPEKALGRQRAREQPAANLQALKGTADVCARAGVHASASGVFACSIHLRMRFSP